MHDTLRAKVRSVTDRVLNMTRVLPGLGFGREQEPPTDPLHREDASTRRPEDQPEQHDQQHVQQVPRQERGHPKR